MIRRVLVANRGEIAVRVIEACRNRGTGVVSVYAEQDRHAPHVTDADAAVALVGTSASATYLDGARLIAVALEQGCDAVHPGYGFLSESAGFARAVGDAGLTWIGPHPEAIERMGDKLAAKAVAAAAGVPTLPSAGLTGEAEFEWRAQAGAVGYPLLVKAAAGGGGRGMRLVGSPDELAEAVPSARREAQASFGDGTVFAERWLGQPRHIEVQVVADRHGAVVHLGERECSIQRRHQKIIEEAPSPAVDEDLRERLGAAAVALARAIGYDSVGTVEFLLDDTTGEFFFLEMNTRIQVEHRITELVTRTDLVELQLASAEGQPLDAELGARGMHGHAIEARLYAEDPARDWLPSTGLIRRFEPTAWWSPHTVIDAGIDEGSTVSADFDPMLAKVITAAATRQEAATDLVDALRSLVVHGVTTNRDALVAMVEHPDFSAGRTTTAFLAEHPEVLSAGPSPDAVRVHLLVAALAGGPCAPEASERRWAFAPSGWRNVGAAATGGSFDHRGETHQVSFRLTPGGEVAVTVDDAPMTARISGPIDTDRSLTVEIDGVTRRFALDRDDDRWFVSSSLGHTTLHELPRFARAGSATAGGGPTAPVPGRVVGVAVTVGQVVAPGDTLVVLEAMKVEHPIRSVTDAVVVEILVAAGETVDAHQLLIRLEETS